MEKKSGPELSAGRGATCPWDFSSASTDPRPSSSAPSQAAGCKPSTETPRAVSRPRRTRRFAPRLASARRREGAREKGRRSHGFWAPGGQLRENRAWSDWRCVLWTSAFSLFRSAFVGGRMLRWPGGKGAQRLGIFFGLPDPDLTTSKRPQRLRQGG